MESITSVSPSHLPIPFPKKVGFGSLGCERPSTGIERNVFISSYRNATRVAFWTISNGTPLMLAPRDTATRETPSGFTDLSRLYSYAALPAGVNEGPPELSNIVRSKGPCQKPERSG